MTAQELYHTALLFCWMVLGHVLELGAELNLVTSFSLFSIPAFRTQIFVYTVCLNEHPEVNIF
jgi:hypothetical protein